MTARVPFRRRIHRQAASALLGALVVSTLAVGGVAAGGGATTIDGVQHEAGSCGGDGYRMTGDLVGCWWIDTFESKTDASKSNFRATGTEHFEGCLGSVCGTFTTTFSYTAKMIGPWGDFNEIHGRCHHPVTGGTGGFAGASGVISFTDVVDEGAPFYPYWGNIRLARS